MTQRAPQCVSRWPWHVRSSVSSLWPFWQLHSKEPTVFRQKWSQPPLFSWHSSMSGRRKKVKTRSEIAQICIEAKPLMSIWLIFKMHFEADTVCVCTQTQYHPQPRSVFLSLLSCHPSLQEHHRAKICRCRGISAPTISPPGFHSLCTFLTRKLSFLPSALIPFPIFPLQIKPSIQRGGLVSESHFTLRWTGSSATHVHTETLRGEHFTGSHTVSHVWLVNMQFVSIPLFSITMFIDISKWCVQCTFFVC